MVVQVLVGESRSPSEALRPLAYSTLADLIHHVRSSLSLPQLACVLKLFSRNVHDPALPVTIQTTSARLLLNLTGGGCGVVYILLLSYPLSLLRIIFITLLILSFCMLFLFFFFFLHLV